MSNHAFTLLAPESWKSASSQNVSQTVSTRVIWFEFKSGFYSIGTGLLEVCKWSDPTLSIRDGLDSRNLSFHLLAPESWKSASGLVVSQTDAFDSGGSCESKYMLQLIDTGILEVCEWSDNVSDRRFRLGRVMGVEIYA